MAKGFTIEAKGFRELGLKFQILSADVQEKVARAVSNAGAQEIKKLAVQKAPVDTGNLRRNIIVKRLRPDETRDTSEHIVTVRRGKLTKKQQASGRRDAFYATWVEFGKIGNDPPRQPFLRPAFDQGKQRAIDAMKKRFKVRIDKANKP